MVRAYFQNLGHILTILGQILMILGHIFDKKGQKRVIFYKKGQKKGCFFIKIAFFKERMKALKYR